MAQNNFVEDTIKKNGRALNHEVKLAKKEVRAANKKRILARKLHGMKAIQFNKKNRTENVKKKKELKKIEKETKVVT
ncbi:hypothetical protein H311_01419, partial [Anncaliia algerae PRA109]